MQIININTLDCLKLVPLINECWIHAEEIFKCDDKLFFTIEPWIDSYGHYRFYFVINTSLDVVTAGALEDKFDEWWIENMYRCSGKLSVVMDYYW